MKLKRVDIMAAVYDATVRTQLYNYERSLVRYPISPQRRREKVKKLRQFLQSLSQNPYSNPICDSKKLGQIFNVNGNPLDLNLRQTSYEDESGTQWRISFLKISKNKVKIYRLMQASFVTDEKHLTSNKLKLNEEQFYTLITECVKNIIKKII